MKNLIIFILSFFACLIGFAQNIEKRYFENDLVRGGDALIKSSNVKVENDEIYKTFELEISETSAYYLDAWIMAPLISVSGGYPEYKVSVNGVLSEFTFKPQTDGWHSLTLTDAKKSVTTVNLKKGINEISVIGQGPEIPNVEFIKLSSNFNRTGISDSKYREFVGSIESNTLNEVYNINYEQIISNIGTSGEIYDYCLDMPVFYTTRIYLNFSTGQAVNISTSSAGYTTPALNHKIELFHRENPESYSWYSSTTSGYGSLNVSIPVTGTYLLLIRTPPSNSSPFSAMSGFVTLDVNSQFYSNCIVSNSVYAPVSNGYPTPANFFICKISDGRPYLYLEDNSGYIRLSDYNTIDSTSDGYYWGKNPRMITNMTNLSYGHAFSNSVLIPYMKCDLYMGLAEVFYTDSSSFPNLPADNSFRSGPGTGPYSYGYNCTDWSIGISADSMQYVPNNWRFYSTLSGWDDFYESYGYTRLGATVDNAAIALWMNGKNYTHASVRKNSTILNPHGFEWESKCGQLERVMHTRDALNCDTYGSIAYYYRPISGTVNSPPINNTDNSISTHSLISSESRFSPSELNQIATLKSYIPTLVASGFDEKYHAWVNTWSKPEIAIHSNPYMYAKSSEYENLVQYCMKYGKATWSLVFDKLAHGDIFVISLLKDLTYNGNSNFDIDIMPIIVEAGKQYPSLYSILVDYCKRLLAKEEANILKSIMDISTAEEGSFEVSISVNAQQILINLFSLKDEKASVTIYSVFGGLEFETRYNVSKGNQMLVINASNFKKGIYIMKITIDGESISQTISI